MKCKKYSGKNGIDAEQEFTEDYRFATALLQYVSALSDGVSWFVDECIENEDGTYFVIFRSFNCPEYQSYILSIKVESSGSPAYPWEFSVQKKIPK